jgi:hypothetical protein
MSILLSFRRRFEKGRCLKIAERETLRPAVTIQACRRRDRVSAENNSREM